MSEIQQNSWKKFFLTAEIIFLKKLKIFHFPKNLQDLSQRTYKPEKSCFLTISTLSQAQFSEIEQNCVIYWMCPSWEKVLHTKAKKFSTFNSSIFLKLHGRLAMYWTYVMRQVAFKKRDLTFLGQNWPCWSIKKINQPKF